MAKTVDDCVTDLDGWRAQVVVALRRLINPAAPKTLESIKSSQLVYELNGLTCYIKAFKYQVNFGFWRGQELDDPAACSRAAAPTSGTSSCTALTISSRPRCVACCARR